MLRVLAAAEAASSLEEEALPALRGMLEDPDSAVRTWAVMGFLMRGEAVAKKQREVLRTMMHREDEESAYPRLTAAHALAKFGNAEDLEEAMAVLLGATKEARVSVYENLWVLNGIDDIGVRAAPWKTAIEGIDVELSSRYDRRMGAYAKNLIKAILMDLE